MSRRAVIQVLVLSLAACTTFAQVANGNLQIHHIDMGQGDSAVLISPAGTVVLLDAGRDMAKNKDCGAELDYLDQLGVKQIDYVFVSHYHYDHIECVPDVLQKFPLVHEAFDRGTDQVEPTTATYKNYVKAVGNHRKTAVVGQELTLDQAGAAVRLKVLSASGHYANGTVSTKDENDLSVSVLVSFGGFREEIGGDLSGEETQMYQDVESYVAPGAGALDVYKVHHHCSSHSSNEKWMSTTQPTVAVISTGDGNSYRHPAVDCLQRLHEADVKRVYWTEQGAGGTPSIGDVVGGDIVIEVVPNATKFAVSYGHNSTDTYDIKNASPNPNVDSVVAAASTPNGPKYAWSVRADHYYDATCSVVARISEHNLRTGDAPPPDKRFKACPTH